MSDVILSTYLSPPRSVLFMLNHNNYPDHIKIFPVNGKVFTTWLKLKTCLIFLPQHPNPNPIGQYHQNISFFFFSWLMPHGLWDSFPDQELSPGHDSESAESEPLDYWVTLSPKHIYRQHQVFQCVIKVHHLNITNLSISRVTVWCRLRLLKTT